MPYVYLIQPVELVSTNRYKIGMSTLPNLNRMRSYKCGTRYLFVCDCDDALSVERKLINVFNSKYKLIAGNEYFECDNELEMVNLFVNTVMNHKNYKQPTVQRSWMEKFAFKNTPKTAQAEQNNDLNPFVKSVTTLKNKVQNNTD